MTNQVASVIREKQNEFYNWSSIRKGSGKLQHLSVGFYNSLNNWELATEEEWLATKEKIEFK